MRRLLRHDGFVAAVSGGAVLVVGLVVIEALHGARWYPTDLGDYRWSVLCVAVAIAVTRWAPRSVLALVAVIVGSPWWSFGVAEVRLVPLVVVGYLAASRGARLVFVIPVVLCAALSGMFPFWMYQPRRVLGAFAEFGGHSTQVLLITLTLAAVLLGASSARRRRAESQLRARNDELVRLREVDADRATLLERARIAREIHDVIAHHLTAIVIRAQAARRTASGDAVALEETVGWVAESGQEALGEIRKIVRVLRDSGEPALSVEPVDLAHALGRVVDRVREAGLRVEMTVEATTLTPIQDFAVLRITQEALTNALLHSGADRARLALSVDRRTGAFTLTIDDDGGLGARRAAVPAIGAGGSGLRGMHERAAAIDARLSAGPTSTGWRVELVAPLHPSATADPPRVDAPRPQRTTVA